MFGKKKIDVILVIDCGAIKHQKPIVEQAINKMAHTLKTSTELSDCEVSFSFVPFSEDIIQDKCFFFMPVEKLDKKIDLGDDWGFANPGPILRCVTVKALTRYEMWKANGEVCVHPLIFFFTDGYLYFADHQKLAHCRKDYENTAKFIKEKEERNKLLFIGGAFGRCPDIPNIKLLTAHPERILKIPDENSDKLEEFFTEIIPRTTICEARGYDKLSLLFQHFCCEE